MVSTGYYSGMYWVLGWCVLGTGVVSTGYYSGMYWVLGWCVQHLCGCMWKLSLEANDVDIIASAVQSALQFGGGFHILFSKNVINITFICCIICLMHF